MLSQRKVSHIPEDFKKIIDDIANTKLNENILSESIIIKEAIAAIQELPEIEKKQELSQKIVIEASEASKETDEKINTKENSTKKIPNKFSKKSSDPQFVPDWKFLKEKETHPKENIRINHDFLSNYDNTTKIDHYDILELMLKDPQFDNIEDKSKYVAIDCEMVGAGRKGAYNRLARVSIVDYQGIVLLDKYVKQTTKVTNYRTWVSGITPSMLVDGEDYQDVKETVQGLLENKIIVGHAVSNDFRVLGLRYPPSLVRDTSKYRHFVESNHGNIPSLKQLTFNFFNLKIQISSHSSVHDARATMALYRLFQHTWENGLINSSLSVPNKRGFNKNKF